MQGDRLPSGVVTFLFTDVEGSTRWWSTDAEGMAQSLRHHDDVVLDALERHEGYVFATGGDGFCVAFDRPETAVSAATAIQRNLSETEWPGPELRVRVGVHLGEADERGGDYFGTPVITAARVASAGHGGQVLVTDAVRSSVGASGVDLGPQLLRDVPDPVHVWQLGAGEFPPLRTATARSNLPSPPTRLVGRDDDVRTVRLSLADHRLVTLVALGGTGKTRLAIAVADEELAHWRDGVCFVDLTAANDGDDVLPVVARALGFEPRSPARSHEIVASLAVRELLLVLDNCEHVLDACAALTADLLSGGERTKVLAISRVVLDIDGEHVVHVEPLATDGATSPAVKLFADRAVAVVPDFELDGDNVEAVVELCRHLDGVPLAIELAASRSGVMTPAELLAGLGDRFRMLSGGRLRRGRHGPLEATIDWSYDLLRADERAVFRALGVFADSFDIEAVAAVCALSLPEATDIVEVLYARSLITPNRGSASRFRLLETLKDYAERRLVEAGELEAVRERHGRHFREVGRVETLLEAWNLERCIRLLPDVANLVLAADWLERHGRWDDLARHLFGIAFVSGDEAASMSERLDRCRAHLDRAELVDAVDHATVFCTMALADWMAYIDVSARLRDSPHRSTTAFGYLYLALVLARHAPDEAHSMIERFEALVGDDAGESADHATFWRSMVEAMSGDLTTAAALASEIVDRPVGLTSLALNAHTIVGVEAWTRNEPEPVLALADRLESARRATGRLDPYYENLAGFSRALASLIADPPERAQQMIRDHAREAASGRVALVDGDALGLIAELERRHGDSERARAMIMSTGPGRSPASIALLRWIADRLGVLDELDEAYREHYVDAQWMIERPREALRRELDRRRWS